MVAWLGITLSSVKAKIIAGEKEEFMKLDSSIIKFRKDENIMKLLASLIVVFST